MKRIPRTRMWPDLEYRVERAAQAVYAHKVDEAREQFQKAYTDKFIEFARKAENELIEHLRECANCRKTVADLTRMGHRFPQRVLEAAKIDVLN